MENAIYQITLAVLTLLSTIIVYILVPYIKTKTTESQRKEVAFWVTVATSAAEMIFNEKGSGPIKKEVVVDFVKNMGFNNVSDDQIDFLVEAIVFELKKIEKELFEK